MRILRRPPPSSYEFQDLANYNAERARGIRHTEAWQERMAEEQRRFDVVMRERAIAEGAVVVERG